MGLGEFICRNDSERARLLDLSRRMRGAEMKALGLISLAVVICIPTFGPLPILPLLAAGVGFWLAQSRLHWVRRPEQILVGCWLLAQLAIAAAVVLAGGPSLYLLSLFVFPVLLGSLVFPKRVALAGVGITVPLMVATAFLANPTMLSDAPFALVFPLAVTIAASIPASAVRDLDIQARHTAVIDPVTGVLGRLALESRAAELTHQAALVDQKASVIVGDVDRFKQINDEHGHGFGDCVLRAVGERLTAAMGTAEPVYRLGGEEFIVLLAGTDAAAAAEVAERLREAVGSEPIEAVELTMSFGVADSDGDPFVYERVFGAADTALYTAKRDGRNRVAVAARGTTSKPIGHNGSGSRQQHGDGFAPAPGFAVADPDPGGDERWAKRLAAEHAEGGSWLVQDDVQREHLLDLNRRIRESNRPAYAVTFAAVVAAAFVYGWITVIPPALAAIFYNVCEHRLERVRRPEYLLAIGWLVAQTGNAIGIAFVHFSGPDAPLFASSCMLIMVTASCGVVPRRGALIGTSFAIVATILSGIAINPSLVLHDPCLLALPVALVAAAGLVGSAAGRSAIEYRGAAVVDRLTGMLNRSALDARAAELTHHSSATGQGVAVIVGDLDRFKSVNDAHGHAVGDRVLQEVAYRIRKHLRAFDSAYRMGGEEFVVLLPGVSIRDADETARRVWEAVRGTPVGDVTVTMSFGVCASSPGESFDYQRVFERADKALYLSKRDGRDCIRIAPGDGAAAEPEAAPATAA